MISLSSIVPFPAPVLDTSPIVTATTITISGSVPSGSVVTSVTVKWQRDTSVGCPGIDEGSTIVSGAFSTYTITGLEEDSRYSINVTAVNAAGSGPVSNTITATTTEAGMYIRAYVNSCPPIQQHLLCLLSSI